MNRIAELKKFMTSQYIYYGLRMTFAVVVPCIIMAYYGVLAEYFAFPLGTMLMTNMDQPGPFVRRRNTFIIGIICFFIVSLAIGLTYQYPVIVAAEIVLFGMFFSLIGIYGTRLSAMGSLTLVVFAILIDGHFGGGKVIQTSVTLTLGGLWAFLLFFILSKIQPYILVKQILGENFIELGNFIRIKSKFYRAKPDFDALFHEMMSSQIKLKEHHEDLREILFTTRTYVNESTTTSRIIMLMFLESIDLFEQILTSQQDYKTMHEKFDDKNILPSIHRYIEIISSELINIGIAVQANQKAFPIANLDKELMKCYQLYYDLRNTEMNHENFQDFMMLRQILMNLSEITKKVKTIYRASGYDEKLAKSLSFGLDFEKFAPKTEKINLKLLKFNLSLKSAHFRHALRITIALLIGYIVSLVTFVQIGHSYWILITILAIQKPAFSITKSRNLLRLGGTLAGATLSFAILYYISNTTVLFIILLVSMVLCYTFLKHKYMTAIFFMTIYVFMSFNFLSPGNFQVIFADRIIDTLIGGAISFLVSYFVFPVWERTQNKSYVIDAINGNKAYFKIVCEMITEKDVNITQDFKETRKDAIIALANLSDNFQRMLSDPKFQQHLRIKRIHQFVNTSHLLTAYIASLSMYAQKNDTFAEVDLKNWRKKIMLEFTKMQLLLNVEGITEDSLKEFEDYQEPSDKIETLLEKRRREIMEREVPFISNPEKISRLTELKSMNELLALINNVTEEQVKVIERFLRNQDSTTMEKKKSSNLFSWAQK
ncbi:FUSC family protein [Elizabethkingia anophelis]|nr:FUSC family protein [Elizabethkingia anophelis]MCT3957602.1 FUSC family protein [Elizabethkingia anophelis]MCT4061245.1 FUSC family protein [Elizabethkingia anophelis]MCT4107536.1 FUSC family protein [Elizabethkingia anophelis]